VTACGEHRTVLARNVPDNTRYLVLYDVDYIEPDVQQVNFLGCRKLAPEGGPEVAGFDVEAVLEDSQQAVPGRGAGQSGVAFAQPVELPDQVFASRLEVVVQSCLRVGQVIHACQSSPQGDRAVRVRRHLQDRH
jgi:hypothetical protein